MSSGLPFLYFGQQTLGWLVAMIFTQFMVKVLKPCTLNRTPNRNQHTTDSIHHFFDRLANRMMPRWLCPCIMGLFMNRPGHICAFAACLGSLHVCRLSPEIEHGPCISWILEERHQQSMCPFSKQGKMFLRKDSWRTSRIVIMTEKLFELRKTLGVVVNNHVY